MILTMEYAQLIYDKANVIRKTITETRYYDYGFQEYMLNKSKIIIVNETLTGKAIIVKGVYKVVANTSNILILLAPVNEEVIIITERDFYIG
jgi:ERCC4-related helicase